MTRTPTSPPQGALEHGPTVIFDTDCILCSRWVHFVLANERHAELVFVRARSGTGQALAARHGLSPADLNRTYLVIEDGQGLTHSAASLALLRHLRLPWRWFRIAVLVPRPLRDRFYSWVARNRYAWFGRKDDCFIPPAAARRRFIQD